MCRRSWHRRNSEERICQKRITTTLLHPYWRQSRPQIFHGDFIMHVYRREQRTKVVVKTIVWHKPTCRRRRALTLFYEAMGKISTQFLAKTSNEKKKIYNKTDGKVANCICIHDGSVGRHHHVVCTWTRVANGTIHNRYPSLGRRWTRYIRCVLHNDMTLSL